MTAHRRIHLDTDLGSDTDDLCALAMLLGADDVEIVGVTTNTDPGGVRAGMTEYALALAGQNDIEVRAGAEGSLAGLFAPLALPEYWPERIEPRPGAIGDALALLEANAEAGATIVAIGPYTNLALLEAARPGLLATTRVVVMGGHVPAPASNLPQWGAHDDFNIQQDRFAATVVLERGDPIVVPVGTSLHVHLRAAHLARLRASGSLGRLIADQAEAHARDHRRSELARAFAGLPDDLLNFHYDPLACAVALGWDGASIEDIPMRLDLHGGRLWMSRCDGERELRVVTSVDGDRFEAAWLAAIDRAGNAASTE